jgi:hypothetical protein
VSAISVARTSGYVASIVIIKPPPPPRFDIVVRRVMADVAVNEPLPGLPRFPDHIVPLAGADIHGIREVVRAGFGRMSINGDDLKRATMNDPQSSSDST